MVGRTRRHVVRLPEDVADDSRFCLAHIEAVDADAGAGKIAIQADTGNRLDGGDENPGQLLLMSGGSGDAFVQDISNPGIETGNAGDIGRPRFKDARDSPWLFPFKGMDAVAAGDVRRHDGIAADDNASRPAGTIQRLVARKTGRRHDAVGQVDVNGTGRLGHIDDESQMVAPAKGLDAGQIEDIAGDIGSVVADEPFCLRRQQSFIVSYCKAPLGWSLPMKARDTPSFSS